MPLNIACLIDTDVLIDFLRNRPYAVALLNKYAINGLLAVSTLTHLEIYQGMRPNEETDTTEFLDGLTTIEVTTSIARIAGKTLKTLRARGTTIGVVDAVIAATAQELDVPLLTNNIAHYPFPHLKIVQGATFD
ncbi:MAG: type II toxin-antitoxin system VapC family toxin [Dehalococcoidales bacterium]|nr:type II toxin-antitoxin system VapC family toxin [Dehalococcoidales bacterium]